MSAARTQRKERLRTNHRRMRELERQVELDGGGSSILHYIESAWLVGLTVEMFAHDESQLHDVYRVVTSGEWQELVGFIAVSTDSLTVAVTD